MIVIEGSLPSPREWDRILDEEQVINVVSMPGKAPTLEALRPYAGRIKRLLVNSGSCTDLRLVEDMPQLEELSVGGLMDRKIDASRLSALTSFHGDARQFPGLLNLASLEDLSVVGALHDSHIGAPLRTLAITNARTTDRLPMLSRPELLSKLLIHGAKRFTLNFPLDLTNLTSVHIESCSQLDRVQEILRQASLKILYLENCPNISSFWSLGRMRGVQVTVVGRNPFEKEFRDLVASSQSSQWTFPPSKRFLPSSGDGIAREYLLHPGLNRPLRVPDEASEDLPWEDKLTESWNELSAPSRQQEWQAMIRTLMIWAQAQRATIAALDGTPAGEIDERLAATFEAEPALLAGLKIAAASGDVIASIPGDLDDGIFLWSKSIRALT